MNIAQRVAHRWRFAQKKQRMTVYRISKDRTLDNRNAADLKGIIDFIDGTCEDLKLDFCIKGGSIVEHKIEVNLPFGPYAELRGAGGGAPSRHDRAGTKKKSWGSWFSFPIGAKDEDKPGGWRHLGTGKSISVDKLPKDWGMLGGAEQLKVLERVF